MGKCASALIGLWGLAVVLAGGPGFATCAPDTVDLRWPGGGQTRFSVEIADTDSKRALGLMFRETLPSSAGMLFIFDAPEHAQFWMKNTLIPLDMIFADDSRHVVGVVESAEPLTLTPRTVGVPGRFVIEVAGGQASAHGVDAGDQLVIEDVVVPAVTP